MGMVVDDDKRLAVSICAHDAPLSAPSVWGSHGVPFPNGAFDGVPVERPLAQSILRVLCPDKPLGVKATAAESLPPRSSRVPL